MSLVKYANGTWYAEGNEENLRSVEQSQFGPATLMFKVSSRIWNNKGFPWPARYAAWNETYRLAVRLQEELYLHGPRHSNKA